MERWSLRLPFSSGCAIVALTLWVSSAAAQDFNPWAKGSTWASVRFGYAKSAAEGAADGNVGFGFVYTSFMSAKWSYGASAQIDVLGRYATASQIEAPFSVETARHFKWATPTRPYLGGGLGAFYQKIQGTTDDGASFEPGVYLMLGSNTLVSPRGLIGFDVRVSYVSMDRQDNPVFGGEATTGRHQSHSYHWSAKLSYAWAL
jgi:hypothetical protein